MQEPERNLSMKQKSFWGKKKTHPPHLPGKAPVLGCAESLGVRSPRVCSRSWGAASHTPCLPQRPLHSPAQTPAPRWLSAGPAWYFSSLPGPTSPEPGFTSSQQPRPFPADLAGYLRAQLSPLTHRNTNRRFSVATPGSGTALPGNQLSGSLHTPHSPGRR